MPLDQHPIPTRPETTTSEDDRAATLHAAFIADERPAYLGLYTGAGCVLPTGEAVEVRHKRTPFFALCRELDKRGYGDCWIEISTPAGTPSMRAVVRVAAGSAVKERDRDGLTLEKYRPFHPPRSAPGARSRPRGHPGSTGERKDARQ